MIISKLLEYLKNLNVLKTLSVLNSLSSLSNLNPLPNTVSEGKIAIRSTIAIGVNGYIKNDNTDFLIL